MQKFIVGKDPVPDWALKVITPYKKADGTCGVEIYGSQRIFTANMGDTLVLWDNGYIEIKKKKE